MPAGDYDWQVYHGHVETATDRWISGVFDVQCCGFYGGQLLQTNLTVTLHPDDTFTFSGQHIMEQITLPTGHVTIHIGSIDAAMNFTPDMQLRLQAQYDNISQDLGMSMRYRWEFSIRARSCSSRRATTRRWTTLGRYVIAPVADLAADRAHVPGLSATAGPSKPLKSLNRRTFEPPISGSTFALPLSKTRHRPRMRVI